MNKKLTHDFGMTTPGTYEIIVVGKLDKGWQDWFNAIENHTFQNQVRKQHTILNCHVRDQSELLGVLNRLNSLNFPLYSVRFIGKEG